MVEATSSAVRPLPMLLLISCATAIRLSSNKVKSALEAVLGMLDCLEGEGEGVEWEDIVVAIVAGDAGSDAL